jgi:hypothetical protein
MTAADLKLKIFRQIDALEGNKLEELYGVITNFFNSQNDLNDWEKLSDAQRQGILDAIDEIDAGKGIPHNEVITNMRRKISHG